MRDTSTPLMLQYRQIKSQYPGAILLFRVGDFYEMFGEDAIAASHILSIVLTKRSNGAAASVELAGFPYHALDTYLPKLVKAGYRVAICDQLENPKDAKGIVKRGVTELITPGLSFHDQVLDERKNNYLTALYAYKEQVGIAFLDISTGEFFVAQGSLNYIEKLLQGFKPAEVILHKKQKYVFLPLLEAELPNYVMEDWVFHLDYAQELLQDHFGTASLKGFGIENLPLGVVASGAILRYLLNVAHPNKQHITTIGRLEEDQYVWLDKFTIKNLELIHPQQENGTSLLSVLDKTVTPMGSRLLKKWLLLPLKDVTAIKKRLDMVALFFEDQVLADMLLKELSQIGDLERLVTKVSVGRALPKELLALQKTLRHTLAIQKYLGHSAQEALQQFVQPMQDGAVLLETIQQTLADNPPVSLTQSGVIRMGIDEELDECRKMAYEGKDYLVALQQKEIQNTGISSLKIAYNKIFGYYLEVTHAHKSKVPAHWIRKQTLVQAERYVTEELKNYEEKILVAEQRITEIEHKIYHQLLQEVGSYTVAMLQNAKILAQLDCYLSFARQASAYNYVRPRIEAHHKLILRSSRHPVIEQRLPVDSQYVANDIFLDPETQQIMVITGPNMAGKSALLRQAALIVIMAQIGAFVPAAAAEIGVVDKIFSRVGASDNLALGESTFMVEMTETANIMHNLSARSLVLLDEIGRGTSTYDGISIAWSIVEYLHQQKKNVAKTLFATHYHELNQLADQLPRVKNFNVTVKEIQKKIIFLRKLVEGGTAHSFGINVAQIAGMPTSILRRAQVVLETLEKVGGKKQIPVDTAPHTCMADKQSEKQSEKQTYDAALQEVKLLVDQLDLNTLAPIEALLKLQEIKEVFKKF